MRLRERQLLENTSRFFSLLLPCRDADTDGIDVPDRLLRGASPQREASLSRPAKSAMSMDMTSSDAVRGEPGQVRARHPGELGARKRERADVAGLVDDDQRARILRVEPVDGVLPVGNGCV